MRARSLIANLTLALAGVALTLGVIELLLASLRPVPYSIERNMYYVADPHTGYRLKPYGQGEFAGRIEANANRHGHRSDDVPLFKEPGVFRILVLGDSVTVGASVEQSETYASVLQALLNRDAPPHVEVLNAAVGGWHPFQYAQYYEHYGPEFEPDLVLVGFFVGNDILKVVDSKDALHTAVLGRRVSRRAADSPLVKLRVALHEHSHLARLLLSPSQPRGSFARTSCDELPPFLLRIQRGRREIHRKDSPQLAAKAARAVRHIQRIQQLTAQAGIPLLVLLFPDENQLNPALQALVFPDPALYDLELPQSLLRELFAQAGVEVLDLLPAFRADSRCLFQNDTHWTAEGHALVAQQVYDRLSRGPGPLARAPVAEPAGALSSEASGTNREGAAP